MTTTEQTSIYDAMTSTDGDRATEPDYCYGCGQRPGAQMHCAPSADRRLTCNAYPAVPRVSIFPLDVESADTMPALHLRIMRETAQRVENETRVTVYALREAGWSWSRIANVLGTSKQAAQQRYGRFVN